MFGFFSRIMSTVLIGICLSSFGMILMSLLLSLRHLPRLLASIQNGLRRFLRFSFEVYAALLNRTRIWILYYTGWDVFQTIPRTVATILLSLVMGWGGLSILRIHPLNWMWILFTLHGLFIGLAWEQITTPDDFQLGGRAE